MGRYIQIALHSLLPEQRDIVIAEFTQIGFEGFEETDNSLKAFIPINDYDENAVMAITEHYELVFNKTFIEDANWNQQWESGFEPTVINDLTSNRPWTSIRAEFHAPIKNVNHEIIITPKMSFGTGHHATTNMMVQQMGQIDFSSKTVLDFGTGTGVLAILAEKLGAKRIVAIDNDDSSIENAEENIQRNHCTLIDLRKTGSALCKTEFDIILANINKNVIVDNFSIMKDQLSSGGVLLLSGILQEDENDISRKSNAYNLQLLNKATRDNWLCLKYSR